VSYIRVIGRDNGPALVIVKRSRVDRSVGLAMTNLRVTDDEPVVTSAATRHSSFVIIYLCSLFR